MTMGCAASRRRSLLRIARPLQLYQLGLRTVYSTLAIFVCCIPRRESSLAFACSNLCPSFTSGVLPGTAICAPWATASRISFSRSSLTPGASGIGTGPHVTAISGAASSSFLAFLPFCFFLSFLFLSFFFLSFFNLVFLLTFLSRFFLSFFFVFLSDPELEDDDDDEGDELDDRLRFPIPVALQDCTACKDRRPPLCQIAALEAA
mmetsp:Transcript_36633/g.92187  ORF Transcript_36633/g.92187 Transcript_36633/m.92187 type:complete len:205 (-) Transcript_36633:33-647(-)